MSNKTQIMSFFFFLRIFLKTATGKKKYKKALAVLQFKWDLKDMAFNAKSDHLHQNEKKKYDKMQTTGSTGTNQKMDTRLDKMWYKNFL